MKARGKKPNLCDIREKDWTRVWLTVELKRRWQMLQEMMGFFLGGATPKVWLITAFCTGSIYNKKHTHMHIHEHVSPASCFPWSTLEYNKDDVGESFLFQRALQTGNLRTEKPWEKITRKKHVGGPKGVRRWPCPSLSQAFGIFVACRPSSLHHDYYFTTALISCHLSAVTVK